jgi:hypothetical protein
MDNVRRFAIGGLLVFAVVACFTWTVAQEAPQPGPEHEKLGFFVGKWTSEGELKENAMGMPPGKFSGKDECEWFEGKFSVVCKNEGDGPMGHNKGIGIMSYSATEGVYTYYGTDSMGMTMTSVPRGKVDGKTWVYDDESKMGDKTIKNRYTIVETSPDSYTFKWEVQGPDGWTTVMEGKSARS